MCMTLIRLNACKFKGEALKLLQLYVKSKLLRFSKTRVYLLSS